MKTIEISFSEGRIERDPNQFIHGYLRLVTAVDDRPVILFARHKPESQAYEFLKDYRIVHNGTPHAIDDEVLLWVEDISFGPKSERYWQTYKACAKALAGDTLK